MIIEDEGLHQILNCKQWTNDLEIVILCSLFKSNKWHIKNKLSLIVSLSLCVCV